MPKDHAAAAANPRDRMLVAWRPGTKVDGLMILAHEGDGLVWLDAESPYLGHWWYDGVPILNERHHGPGLWIWEGWVEGASREDREHFIPFGEIWTGQWRRATVGDLVRMGFMPALTPQEALAVEYDAIALNSRFGQRKDADWSARTRALTGED